MTPYVNGKSEKKIPYIFKFSINKSEITSNQVKILLEQYGFTKFLLLEKDPIYDFQMKLRLEEHFNAIKLCKDLIKKYKKYIMEINSEKFHHED